MITYPNRPATLIYPPPPEHPAKEQVDPPPVEW